MPLEVIQDLHIRRVVASTRTIASAANILGVHSGTVIRRMKRFGNEAGLAPPAQESSENGAINGTNRGAAGDGPAN